MYAFSFFMPLLSGKIRRVSLRVNSRKGETGTMAMKERIKNTLDLQKKQIADSKHLTPDEKLQLTELVSESAECTNGYGEGEKVQRVAETTFHVTMAMARVMDQLAENNDLTKDLDGTMKQVVQNENRLNGQIGKIGGEVEKISAAVQNRIKRDIRDLGWKDTLKLVLVKPWIWIFLVFFAFSPKCVELVQMLLDRFAK